MSPTEQMTSIGYTEAPGGSSPEMPQAHSRAPTLHGRAGNEQTATALSVEGGRGSILRPLTAFSTHSLLKAPVPCGPESGLFLWPKALIEMSMRVCERERDKDGDRGPN